jgi:hypothetical protein
MGGGTYKGGGIIVKNKAKQNTSVVPNAHLVTELVLVELELKGAVRVSRELKQTHTFSPLTAATPGNMISADCVGVMNLKEGLCLISSSKQQQQQQLIMSDEHPQRRAGTFLFSFITLYSITTFRFTKCTLM